MKAEEFINEKFGFNHNELSEIPISRVDLENLLNEFAEKQLKNCNLHVVNGSILAKAEMINALTNTMKVNKEVLGEYYTIRDKSLAKLKALLDSV